MKVVSPKQVYFFMRQVGGELCCLLPLETFSFAETMGNDQNQIFLQQISLKRLWKLMPVIFRRKTVVTKK